MKYSLMGMEHQRQKQWAGSTCVKGAICRKLHKAHVNNAWKHYLACECINIECKSINVHGKVELCSREVMPGAEKRLRMEEAYSVVGKVNCTYNALTSWSSAW